MDIMISYLVGRWMDKRFDEKAVVLSEGATAARGSCGRTDDKSKHDDLRVRVSLPKFSLLLPRPLQPPYRYRRDISLPLINISIISI